MSDVKLERSNGNEKCPIESTLNIIGTKWTSLIIRDLLLDGRVRFGNLQRSLDGIGPKTYPLDLGN